MSGFVGGLVGGAVTVFGISVVNRRFRRMEDLLPVVVAATVLGGLVEVIAATNPHPSGDLSVDLRPGPPPAATVFGRLVEILVEVLANPNGWAYMLLFVCWQTAVIVLIARALAANQAES
jgi:hypothetical protein